MQGAIWPAIVQAGATVVLVAVTIWYVVEVRRQAEHAADAADAAARSADATKRMAEFLAPEARAQRATSLERLSRIVQEVDDQTKEWQQRGVPGAVLDGNLFGTQVEPETLEQIRSAAGYVGEPVQEKAAAVVEAMEAYQEQIGRADRERREDGVEEVTAMAVETRLTNLRQALAHLQRSVERELVE